MVVERPGRKVRQISDIPVSPGIEVNCTADPVPFCEGDFTYRMSILKSADAEGSACNRFTWKYAPLNGLGHFLHTYVCDGNPIPTFQGEPERIEVCDDIDEETERLWKALNEQNKISLYVRYIDLKTGAVENRLVNKNQ